MASRVMRSRQQRVTQQPEPQSRARWTTGLTKIFADLMVEEVQKGNKTNSNSFSKKAWNSMCNAFYQKTGLKWDKEQLKSRYAVMRKQHAIVKSLLGRSEFRLDESTGTIVGSNDAWNQYIKGHPDAEPVRGSGCPIYKQLGVIFSESVTNGKHELSAEQDEEVPSLVFCEDSLNTIQHEMLASSFPVKEPLNGIQEEECSSDSDNGVNVADNQPAKHTTTTVMHNTATALDSTSGANRKRGRKGIDDAIAGAILHMAAASRLRTAAIRKVGERYSVADCIKELDAIQGLEKGVYFAALDLFDNRNAREIFLSLKGDKRITWLHRKCSTAHPIS